MARPEDIPQDAIEAASLIVRRELGGHSAAHKTAHGLTLIIARAIMTAKAEEREAVKRWLTREAAANDELEAQIVGDGSKGWHKHFADVQRRNVDAIDAGQHVKLYAAAIRKREG